MIRAEFPEKTQCLFEAMWRYIVLYGGRGGSKSWACARALLILGSMRPLRILCARETQKSISESVHRLLSDQVVALGLENFYTVERARIYGINGTEITFAGIRQNVGNLKSFEGVDICWVEEAQNVSKNSWDVLIPTIRKEGSQIWVTFNPELESDNTYQRFVLSPPPGAKVVRIGWEDNPWFPDVLRQEMEHLKATDMAAYNHVWGGCCISVVAGAIYAEELARVEREGRIRSVPYDPTTPVQTFWDLGIGDLCAIWFVQSYPWEHRFIDYYENQGQPLNHYLGILQGQADAAGRSRRYVYGKHHLPHDARARNFLTGKTVQEQMIAIYGGDRVALVPEMGLIDGINAARTFMSQCLFDSVNCADGLQRLRHYRWAPPGPDGQLKRLPLHDDNSNGADAYRMAAIGVKPVSHLSRPKPVVIPDAYYYGTGDYNGEFS